MASNRFINPPPDYYGNERVEVLEWKEASHNRWLCYHAESAPFVAERIKERNPKTYQEIHTLPVPYYPAIINKLAAGIGVPELKFTGDEAAVAPVRKLLQQIAFTEILQDVALNVEMLRTVGVSVTWDERKAQPKALVVPPTDFDPLIPGGGPDFQDATAVVLHDWVHLRSVEWTKSGWRLFSNKEEAGAGPNEYGILPFAAFQATNAGNSFWKPGGRDLLDVCLTLQYHWSDTFFAGEFQGHGQAVFTNMSPDDAAEKIISPSHGLALSANQDFKFVAPPDATANRRDLIRALEESLANLLELPAEVFAKTMAPSSGIAREISYAGLMARRTKLALQVAKQANNLLAVILRVYNTHVPEVDRIDESIRLLIVDKDWEQRVKQDANEAAQTAQMRISMNVITPVDIIMQERGCTEAEAVVIHEKNKKINAPPAPPPATRAKQALQALGAEPEPETRA